MVFDVFVYLEVFVVLGFVVECVRCCDFYGYE